MLLTKLLWKSTTKLVQIRFWNNIIQIVFFIVTKFWGIVEERLSGEYLNVKNGKISWAKSQIGKIRTKNGCVDKKVLSYINKR